MVYWAFILKIKKGHGRTDGLSDIERLIAAKNHINNQ